MKRKVKKASGAIVLAGMLAWLPIDARVVDAQGLDLAITSNDACADGACCIEVGSLCPVGGGQMLDHKYFLAGCPVT